MHMPLRLSLCVCVCIHACTQLPIKYYFTDNVSKYFWHLMVLHTKVPNDTNTFSLIVKYKVIIIIVS